MYIGCFVPSAFFHSKNPAAGTTPLLRFNGPRHMPELASRSSRALKVFLGSFSVFAQVGIKPQRIGLATGRPSSLTIVTTSCVGRRLYREPRSGRRAINSATHQLVADSTDIDINKCTAHATSLRCATHFLSIRVNYELNCSSRHE